MISARARTIVIAVVTTVWAANFVAGVAVEGYQPSESINGIFMAIVGGLFALGARQENKGNGNPPPTPPPPPEPPPAPQPPHITPPSTTSGGGLSS